MSDTPRTDKHTWDCAEMDNKQYALSLHKFAENLEREADKLAKQCVKNVEEIGQLRAALEQSQKREAMSLACVESWKEDEGADAARLDWLVKNDRNYYVSNGHESNTIRITRENVDAAMEAQNDER